MTKKVTNHNLLLFTNGAGKNKKDWDKMVRLTSREKWDKPFGSKEVGTPVSIDGETGNQLTHAPMQHRKIELPPEFCPVCEETNIEAKDRIARGIIFLTSDHPGLGLKVGDSITHCCCEDCAEKLAWPDEHDTALILPRGVKKRANAVQIQQNCISYIAARQLTGQTGTVLGSETRVEAAKDRNEELK